MDADKTLLEEIILTYYPVAGNSLASIIQSAEICDCADGEHICSEGKLASYELFILRGVVHSCIYKEDGERITTGFYLPQTVVTPHFARTVKGRSLFNLQAIDHVTYARVPVTIFDSLRYSYSDTKEFGLKVVEAELRKRIHHDISFRAFSAKQRLFAFREIYPNLENLVPHTMIASYLGITPVSFSRLRNEISR
jgi:CRP-like cAMP-binding protein